MPYFTLYMDSKVQKQIKRFLELFLKFLKKEEDLFNERAETAVINYSISSCAGSISTCFSTNPLEPKARGEVIREAAEEKAKLSDEFDEYLRLRGLFQCY